MFFVSQRLTQVLKSSKILHFNDSSRFIFFSDCHRGDNSWTDKFARNSKIFSEALSHYYDNGFTYIEIGDGDELWENRSFSRIKRAHGDVFELMRKFHNEGRLYLIWGNHDINKKCRRYVENNLLTYYDSHTNEYKPLFENIKLHEGLILKHINSPVKIFVVHGHQGDLINDLFWPIARFLVRYVWRRFELIGFRNPMSPASNYSRMTVIESNIIGWIKANKQLIIAGHTHRASFPCAGKSPYFNSGCCIHPRYITGIEIQNGEISLVKWSMSSSESQNPCLSREIIEGPKNLEFFLTNN